MKNQRKIVVPRSILAVLVAILAVTLVAPLAANAQVVVSHVRVTVRDAASTPSATAIYCDSGIVTCPNKIWTIPAGGILVTGGKTLVITQSGRIPGDGGNFDTSDRETPTTDLGCTAANPCTVVIELDTGSGLGIVYSNSGPNAINNLNQEGTRINEMSAYSSAFSAPNYTLSIGYADNAHGCTSNCFPSPFNGTLGTTAADIFLGQGLDGFPDQPCTPTRNCFDAGVLLITGRTLGPLVTVTQGGWGAPPHGNNPGAILAANFNSVFGAAGVSIGCPAASLTFKTFGGITGAQAIQNFLPQGGTPGTLTAGNPINPTTSAAGVFAGQVLALQLNVSFSGPVFPGGLSVLPLTSGPAAGLTVGQVLTLANRALGGCLTAADIALLTSRGITNISQLNDIVSQINESFD